MYILVEQIMNGTVTMQIVSTGIDAPTFEEAIKKVKNMKNFGKATITSETDKIFHFVLQGNFPCYGTMENKVLELI